MSESDDVLAAYHRGRSDYFGSGTDWSSQYVVGSPEWEAYKRGQAELKRLEAQMAAEDDNA